MAENQVFQVGYDFDIQELIAQLTQMYKSRGMSVSVTKIGHGFYIDFNDGNEGFNKYIGLGTNIRANLIVNDGALYVGYSDIDWTGKIVAACVGWLTCFIPYITCAVGVYKQFELPKKISNDIFMLINSAGAAAPTPGFGAYPPPPPPPPPFYGEGVKCSNCGAPLSETARFCSECGTRV